MKKDINNSIFSFGNALYNELGKKEDPNKYNPVAEYVCKIEDENDSHSIIARRVTEKSNVLDIGCGVGIIGNLLYKNKKCINYGIEIDKEARQLAENSGCYKKIYSHSIENVFKELTNEKLTFSYIILADVLEHILDPCFVLYNLSKLLKPRGKILISIPNISHTEIIEGLINRKFNYSLTGILDSTHLRFFTKFSFMEMISNINEKYNNLFDCEWLEQTKVKHNETETLLEKLLNEDKEGYAVQNIFELSLLSKNEKPLKLNKFLKKAKTNNVKKINEILERNEQLETENMDFKEKIQNLELELNNMINSKSWKITKPLRSLTNKMKKN